MNIARRGPPWSTHLPATAADSPSITMAIEKMNPTSVAPVSKRSISEVL